MKLEERYDSLIRYYAELHDRDPRQVKKQVRIESSFRPDAISPVGCVGLMQFGEATWKQYGGGDPSERTNPELSIAAGCAYMAALERQFGSLPKALAAFNWGPRHVAECVREHGDSGWYDHLPAETRLYVVRCTDYQGETLP